MGGHPRHARVDHEQTGAVLHAVDDPMPEEAVRVGDDRVAGPVEDDVGAAVLRIVEALGGKLRAVGDEVGPEDGVHGLQARRVAAVAGKHARRVVGGLEAGEGQRRRLPRGVAARADARDDGLGTEFLGHLARLFRNEGIRLVHREFFPLVLAALAHAAQRMQDAVGMVHGLHHGQAAHAQPALVDWRARIALDFHQLVILGVEQHVAPLMTAWPRPLAAARDRQVPLLPLPFLAIEIGIHTFSHPSSPLSRATLALWFAS